VEEVLVDLSLLLFHLLDHDLSVRRRQVHIFFTLSLVQHWLMHDLAALALALDVAGGLDDDVLLPLVFVHFLLNFVDDILFDEVHQLQSATLVLEITHLLHKCHLDLYLLLPFFGQCLLMDKSDLYFSESIEQPLLLLILIHIPSIVLNILFNLCSLIDKVIINFHIF
jgi:hypothetical protein